MTDIQEKELLEILKQYHNIVKHMVIELEADDNTYPVEVLNEIRAILNHIAKCYILDDEQQEGYQQLIEFHIHDAKSHLNIGEFIKYE